jgi:hypothetical protein
MRETLQIDFKIVITHFLHLNQTTIKLTTEIKALIQLVFDLNRNI